MLARQVRFDASGARTVLRVRRQPRGTGYVLQERISYGMEP